MDKGTNEEIEIRVDKVLQLYILRQTRRDILKYFKTKLKIDISIESIDYYIRKAKNKINKKSKFKIDHEIGKSISRMEDLYLKSYTIQDFKTCLSVQKEINNLFGLITQNINIDGELKLDIKPTRIVFVNQAGKEKGTKS